MIHIEYLSFTSEFHAHAFTLHTYRPSAYVILTIRNVAPTNAAFILTSKSKGTVKI